MMIFIGKPIVKKASQLGGVIRNSVALILFTLSVGSQVWAQSFAIAYGPATVHPAEPGGFKARLQDRHFWPVKPIHIIGNVYYVGLSGSESWLITTPQGHFLMNMGVPKEVRTSVEELGFKFSDIKYLIPGHPHHSHVAGLAEMKEMTGAKVLAMEEDIPHYADGGESEDYLPNMLGPVFPPVKVDQALHDGDKITIGGVTMTAHLTPGHTPGCTTWTTVAEEKGKLYTVVLLGGCTPMNQPLVGNTQNPTVAQQFVKQYKTLRSIKGDVLLGLSPKTWFDLNDTAKRMEKNPGTNLFINPQAYQEYVATNEKKFYDQWQREKEGKQANPIIITASPPCPKDARACYNSYDIIMDCCKKLGATPIPYTVTTLAAP